MKQSVSFWEFTKLSVGRATRQYFSPYVNSENTKELERLLDATKDHVMTPEEREEQRRSFAHGNAALSNPAVTREVIDRASDEMKSVTKTLDIESMLWQTQRVLEGLANEISLLKKLVDAADYLQHCRRSAPLSFHTAQAEANKQRVQRASDQYDYLRAQVKL